MDNYAWAGAECLPDAERVRRVRVRWPYWKAATIARVLSLPTPFVESCP